RPEVRAAAVRALGRIRPDPKGVSAALGKALASKAAVERRAAAEALGVLVQVRGSPLAAPALALAGKGLADEEGAVRRLCLGALGLAARGLADSVPDNEPEDNPRAARARREQLEGLWKESV